MLPREVRVEHRGVDRRVAHRLFHVNRIPPLGQPLGDTAVP